MSFCKNCGKQLPDGANFCHYCGAAQAANAGAPAEAYTGYQEPAAPGLYQPRHAAPEPAGYQTVENAAPVAQAAYEAPGAGAADDSVSVWLVILSAIIPIFGLIYWPVKAKTRPRCAKICGIVSIAAWIAGIVLSQTGL